MSDDNTKPVDDEQLEGDQVEGSKGDDEDDEECDDCSSCPGCCGH